VELSRLGKNLVLFVPDAASGPVVAELLASELGELYEGFVQYANTAAVGPFTAQNVAALVGGPRFHPLEINRRNDKTIKDNIVEAYAWLDGAARQAGFVSQIFNPAWLRCRDLPEVPGCHVVDDEGIARDLGLSASVGSGAYPSRLLALSLLKVSPFLAKPLVYGSKRWDSAFKSDDVLNKAIVLRYPMYAHLQRLPALAVIHDDRTPRFLHYWNSALISPFATDAQCGYQRLTSADLYTKVSRRNSTRCVLAAFGAFLQWLKDNDIYDNTKVVIASDHGAADYGPTWYGGALKAVLLVKEYKARGPLQTSTRLMQNSDIAGILCVDFKDCSAVGPDRTQGAPHEEVTYVISSHGSAAFLESATQFDVRKVFRIQGSINDYEIKR
jgi:hypothetical protein